MSKTGDQSQTLRFESPHKFFHMMMNMCDDDLDLHQYRLYGHYLRVAGEQGSCTESVRTTASKCRMGHTTVIRVRRELAKLGYIKVDEPTVEEAQRGETVKIELVNRWSENIARYAKLDPIEEHPGESVPNGEQGVPEQEQVSVTTQEQGVPNGESKKKDSKEPVQEEQSKSQSIGLGDVFRKWNSIKKNDISENDRLTIPRDVDEYGIETVWAAMDKAKERAKKPVYSWNYVVKILDEVAIEEKQPPPKVPPKGSPAPAPTPPEPTPEEAAARLAGLKAYLDSRNEQEAAS